MSVWLFFRDTTCPKLVRWCKELLAIENRCPRMHAEYCSQKPITWWTFHCQLQSRFQLMYSRPIDGFQIKYSIDGGKTKWWLGYGVPQDSSLESFDPPLRLRHWRSVWLCWFFLLGNGTSCPCSMDSMGWIIPRPKKWKKKRLVPDASSAALAPAWVCWVMWRLERLGRRRARASWLGDVQPSAGKVPWVWSLPRKTLGTELAQFFSSTTSWVALSILSIFFPGSSMLQSVNLRALDLLLQY